MQPINELSLELEKVATNLNYLISVKKARTLLVISDNKGEGKTTFLSSIPPLMNKIYSKRILIVNDESSCSDSLKSFLNVKDSNSFIKETSCKGVDYFGLNSKDQEIGLVDSVEFYDVILINTVTNRKGSEVFIPSINIDGAILLKSRKSLNAKDGDIVNSVLDKDIPVLGVLYNGGF